MKKASKVLSLVLVLAMLLTSCGGGSSKDSSSSAASSSAAGASKTEGGSEASGEAGIQKMTSADTLVVGAPEMNGDYIKGFTNSSYDVWIRRLIGTYDGDLAYATYYPDEAGEFKANKTILAADPVRKENEDGSVTYTFKLKDNLLWSDGQKITAKDYVFTNLFINSPEWTALGTTNNTSGEELLGFKAYHSGESKAHAGLHLVDEHTFSVTVSKDYVPYFYETALVAGSPTPLHRYAPNLEVVDSPEGAMLQTKEGYKITDADKKSLVDNQQKLVDSMKKDMEKTKEEILAQTDEKDSSKKLYNIADYEALVKKLDALTPEQYAEAKKAKKLADGTSLGDGTWLKLYDSELEVRDAEKTLKEYKEKPDSMDPTHLLMTEAVLDVSQNFRFKPDVTCGPYKFVEFANNMAKVTINDKFVGNKDGKKPTIKNVIVQTVNTDLEVDFVISGDLDIAAGVVEGPKIDKARAEENKDKVGYVAYPRNGYGLMPIICDMGATQYKGVRQAIAYSLDRDEFVQTICGGYGAVVQGAYGLNMWEYKEFADEINEKFINYTLNPDAANKALDKDSPYKFEKDGKTPFDPKKAQDAYNKDKEKFDYWRYDENGKRLTVYHEGPVESKEVSGLISTKLPDNAKLCGMQYIFSTTDFATLLTHYYSPDKNNEKAATVFNMGNSFSIPNDPYFQYHSSQIGADNKEHVKDPELDKVLEKMRKVAPTDRKGWLDGWIKFERWYNENMPGVPLYGNEYHDIYNKRVQGLETTPMWDWANDICDVSLSK